MTDREHGQTIPTMGAPVVRLTRSSLPCASENTPGLARERARNFCAEHPRTDDVELVTSELVTNQVRHGYGEWLDLILEHHIDDTIIVEVDGVSEQPPTEPGPLSLSENGGAGLFVVRYLTRFGFTWNPMTHELRVCAELHVKEPDV